MRKLSHPQALEDAFKSYFAYKTAHPDEVKKPYLYFVDYGLASTEPRGYVFDMSSLKIVDGPFTVAHGRGSSTSQYGVPTKFSNASNSHMTSLGLYVTKATYGFHGHAGGQAYSSVGLQLQGVSTGFNDNAANRRVVAHGAPYVTPTKAGRSEGCPAMEPARAQRLLPELADGAMVFLFAPNRELARERPLDQRQRELIATQARQHTNGREHLTLAAVRLSGGPGRERGRRLARLRRRNVRRLADVHDRR